MKRERKWTVRDGEGEEGRGELSGGLGVVLRQFVVPNSGWNWSMRG